MGNVEMNLFDIIQNGPLEFSHQCHFKVSTSRFPPLPNFEIVAFDISYDYQYRPSVLATTTSLGLSVLGAQMLPLANDSAREKIGKSIDSFKEVTVFKYFDPSSNRDLIDKVQVYYSIYRPDNPLVIVFTTRDCKRHHYRYRKLGDQTIYFRLTREHFAAYNLKRVLLDENSKLNKKLKFRLAGDQNHNVRMIPDVREQPVFVGQNRQFKMVSFIPFVDSVGGRSIGGGYGGSSKGPFVFCLPELFRFQPIDRTLRNYIDQYYLSDVADRKFDGISTFYTSPGNVAVFIEFVSGEKRWQYVRMNLEGSLWRSLKFAYTSEEDLVLGLQEIVSELGIFDRSGSLTGRPSLFVTRSTPRSSSVFTRNTSTVSASFDRGLSRSSSVSRRSERALQRSLSRSASRSAVRAASRTTSRSSSIGEKSVKIETSRNGFFRGRTATI